MAKRYNSKYNYQMDSAQISKHNHYVPEFLFEPWVMVNPQNQRNLRAYYWDQYNNKVRCRFDKGPGYYCNREHLFTFRAAHRQGRDVIETRLFGDVDTNGSKVRDILIENGPQNLTGEQRSAFARLLLSLDVRRPENVAKLKGKGAETLKKNLDSYDQLLEEMAKAGITEKPSDYYTKMTGVPFEDHALTLIPKLVDNPRVGEVLINANWDVFRLTNTQSLILSDRPLIRINAYDTPSAIWVLPLTPKIIFVAANHLSNLKHLRQMSQRKIVKQTNVGSASQSDKYVFCLDDAHINWLHKYLH